MRRTVSSRIELSVTESADLVFAIAVNEDYTTAAESFLAHLDGAAVEVEELPDAFGGRLHRIRSAPGTLIVEYRATVTGSIPQPSASPTDLLVFLRPSRYAESDSLSPTAHAEFSGIDDPAMMLSSVSSWVGRELRYEPGSSQPTDGAVQTLLARTGVCRDFAHLCVALLRARGYPARLVSVYAPGLAPMDFHAVAEAWIDGRWCVVDATTLAPRSSLVRIATGRDAADTAFLTVVSGRAELVSTEVTATADVLPSDDLTHLVSLG